MLYNLLTPYADEVGFLNLFNYITLRAGGAFLTSLFIALLCGNRLIIWLENKQKGVDNIREYVPEGHQKKQGTPSMGGLLILLSLIPAVLLWANISNIFIWGVLFLTASFGILGFLDDYLKMVRKRGLSARVKFLWQLIAALVGVLILQVGMPDGLRELLFFPFFKHWLWDLGIFYVVFMVLVVVGTSNAVNLTDGLDGLAIGAVIIGTGVYGVMAYIVGHKLYADYLVINYVAGSGELAIFCGALIGSGLGFLWFNALPARVFMGDTGSLPLGAALGGIAIGVKHELQLLIIGGLFVMEAGSVILQVGSYKLFRRRIFAIAPLHHHFEKRGWAESKIVVRFWILALVFGLLGLATLKLR